MQPKGVSSSTPRQIILRAAASGTKSNFSPSASSGSAAPGDQREEVGDTGDGHASGSRGIGESSHGPAADTSTAEGLDKLSRHDAVNSAGACLAEDDADQDEDDETDCDAEVLWVAYEFLHLPLSSGRLEQL
jgi:hypothetical protein